MSSPEDGDGPSLRPLPAELEPDAHGQAALLLAESILHTLLDRGLVTLDEALATVEAASEVNVEVAAATGESESRLNASLGLLEKIARSLATDCRGEGRDPPVLPL